MVRHEFGISLRLEALGANLTSILSLILESTVQVGSYLVPLDGTCGASRRPQLLPFKDIGTSLAQEFCVATTNNGVHHVDAASLSLVIPEKPLIVAELTRTESVYYEQWVRENAVELRDFDLSLSNISTSHFKLRGTGLGVLVISRRNGAQESVLRRTRLHLSRVHSEFQNLRRALTHPGVEQHPRLLSHCKRSAELLLANKLYGTRNFAPLVAQYIGVEVEDVVTISSIVDALGIGRYFPPGTLRYQGGKFDESLLKLEGSIKSTAIVSREKKKMLNFVELARWSYGALDLTDAQQDSILRDLNKSFDDAHRQRDGYRIDERGLTNALTSMLPKILATPLKQKITAFLMG